MTEKEIRKILAIITVSYPNYRIADVNMTVKVWQTMLSGYSYQIAEKALYSYIASDESGFSPTIGQIISKINLLSTPQELNEMEAWSMVSKAICNSVYNFTEEYARLPPIIQKCVGSAEQLHSWAIDYHYNENVVSSNFMNCYRSEMKKKTEINKMPKEAKEMVEANGSVNYIEDKSDSAE